MRRGALGLALTVLTVAAARSPAQSVPGTAFGDRDDNGRRDPGEPALAGVQIELYGVRDVGGATNPTATTAADGSFSFGPGNGCYLLRPVDPAGWRAGRARD